MPFIVQVAGIALIVIAAGLVIRPRAGFAGPALVAKVLLALVVKMVECLLAFFAFLAIVAAVVFVVAVSDPDLDQKAIYDSLDITTSHLMIPGLMVLCGTGIAAAWMNRVLLRRVPWLSVTAEQTQLEEYLIQWSTIYLTVYQLVFNELTHAATDFQRIEGIQVVVDGVLNPDNVNLTVLPLLFSVWVAIVVEKMYLHHHPTMLAPEAAQPTPGEGASS